MIEGDARDKGILIRALNGCDGVVGSLGTGLSPFREVSLPTVATGALVTAMTRKRRAPSGLHQRPGGRGQPAVATFDRLFLPLLLSHAYKDNDGQEAAIRARSLDWVIVTDLAGVNGGKIARADVARFVVEQLNTWLRRTPFLLW